MAIPSLFSPGFRAGLRRRRNFSSRLCAVLLWPLLAAAPCSAEMPDYLRTALEKFVPEVPRNWAYSLTTERDGKSITERYDPAKPPAEQWALLNLEGHAPTGEDQEKYFKYKASQLPGATQATFHRADIEPGTLKLVEEDSDHAEFTCAFREQSANADKMLGHLRLRLTVNKQQRHVEKFNLTLAAPYSPVLSVRMRELVVTMNFSPPSDGRPSLPARSSSHFAGRIFLIPVEENIAFIYFDFAMAVQTPAGPAVVPPQ